MESKNSDYYHCPFSDKVLQSPDMRIFEIGSSYVEIVYFDEANNSATCNFTVVVNGKFAIRDIPLFIDSLQSNVLFMLFREVD